MGNHWFATSYIYYKDKLEIRESKYNSYFFYNSSSFLIIGMQIVNKLILVNNNFASIEEDVIKLAKILIKNRKYLTLTYFLNFNSV